MTDRQQYLRWSYSLIALAIIVTVVFIVIDYLFTLSLTVLFVPVFLGVTLGFMLATFLARAFLVTDEEIRTEDFKKALEEEVSSVKESIGELLKREE